MNQKNNLDELNSFLFEEEVQENELVDKKDFVDLIYSDDDSDKLKHKFLIGLAILLIIISIISCALGLLFSSGKLGILDGTVVNNYNLYVTHSNIYYGANHIDFEQYRNSENAYNYSFVVANPNTVPIDYYLEFNSEAENDLDFSLINYALIRNDLVVSSGSLNNLSKYNLYSSKVAQNSKDEYVIKLWSDLIADYQKYSFKINIVV